VLVVCGDVSKQQDVEELARRIITELGAVDILVNNAGILPQSARVGVEETSVKDWEAGVGVDLTGVFLVTRSFLRLMKRREKGHIAFQLKTLFN
jgi:NAD(P)-dependent dehydrogenase (short-subunit alcohol dehydrogenase family)